MLFKQVLSLILSLFAILAAGMLFIITLGVGVLPQRSLNFLSSIVGRQELAFVFFALIVVAVVYLLLSFKGKGQPTSILIPSELGEVRITLDTIDSLVHQGTKNTKGIKDLKTRIVVREGGLFIYVKAVLYGDRNIPELSQTMQGVIQDHVYKISGVHVTEVKVLIDNVATDIKTLVS